LILYSRNFAERLQAMLPPGFQVELAMRYGNPSVAAYLNAMKSNPPDVLLVFPQYPQYASATTGSTLEQILKVLAGWLNIPAIRTIAPFYRNIGFLSACAGKGAPYLDTIRPDHVLFSFHGLPERQIRKSAHEAGNCLNRDDSCCETIGTENAFCYRAQCFSTAKGIAERLGLHREDYSITFQSRLGRTPWIGPFTESRLLELAQAGKKDVVVFCPSFTADCLETLEEISIRAKSKFIAGGGNSLTLVPSLNDSDTWVSAARDMVLSALTDDGDKR
jgi:protoporphyrin/coproporphyrin ferrochelatase